MSDKPPAVKRRWLLGDVVEKALSTVGITSERVEAWLGKPCNCKKRRDRLNALDAWARGVLTGKEGAKELDETIGGEGGHRPG